MKWFERFCQRHSRFGIGNLMFYILGGNVAVFAAVLLTQSPSVAAAFYFNRSLVLSGQVWRIVTFLFVPEIMPTDLLSIISFGFFVALYYLMGRELERTFGRLKFTVYYFSGAVLTLIPAWILGITAGAHYLNLAIFLAFATLNPDYQIRLFMIIPIKMKYLAYLDAAYLIFIVVTTPFPHNLLPVAALLNYAVFFWPLAADGFRRKRYRAKAIPFRRTVNRAKRERGYLHKCAVCGLTDADAPGQEFRYCSLCAGYQCYCGAHLFNHEHKK